MAKERFITSIFNYCDYWCERCAFTRRCRNFSMGREMERQARGEKPEDDATRQGFWNRLADQLVVEKMKGRDADWTDDADIDFDAEPDPEYEKREESRRKAVDEHALTKTAEAYMMKVHKWLETADKDLKSVAKEMLEAAGNKFETSDPEEDALEIGDMIEVVAWYHTLIPPKVGRAIGWLIGEDDEGGEGEVAEMIRESRLSDANGSGKVVLMAIERSIAAWVRLRDILPGQEDTILEMLVLLDRLQRGINTALPGAKSFIRPGFDEQADR